MRTLVLREAERQSTVSVAGVSWLLLLLRPSDVLSDRTPSDFLSFGIITDVHYADADPAGTRIYRDSLPKVP